MGGREVGPSASIAGSTARPTCSGRDGCRILAIGNNYTMSPEASERPITPQQERFCHEFVRTLNGSKAAILAGYAARSANVTASELRADPRIQDRIAELEAPRLTAIDVTAENVLKEYAAIAKIDTRCFFDDLGNLKPVKDWTPEMGAALASFEVVQRNLTAGDDSVDTVLKVKLWDKPKALDTLAKHLGLLIEKQQVSGTIEITWKDRPAGAD